jgi:hypothetical protein
MNRREFLKSAFVAAAVITVGPSIRLLDANSEVRDDASTNTPAIVNWITTQGRNKFLQPAIEQKQ